MPEVDLYDQPVKNDVRQRVLGHAIDALTTDRGHSPVITVKQFTKALAYARSYINRYTRVDIGPVVADEAENFLSLQRTRVGMRTPADLQVLYLCGPTPLNDLDVLMQLGVKPYNVWAIESESVPFESAQQTLKEANLPVKLFHGQLHEFFAVVPQQFDIIYVDACAALTGGKPNTLTLLRELFLHQRLTSLAALITNFSEANRDGAHAAAWARRFAAWYAARFEEPIPFDDADTRMHDPDQYYAHIATHLQEYYGDFVSRFIIEFAGQLVPWWRIVGLGAAKREFFNEVTLDAAIEASLQFSSSPTSIEDLILETGHARLSETTYPHLWTAHRLDPKSADCIVENGDPLQVFFHKDVLGRATLLQAVKAVSLVQNIFESQAVWA